MVRRAIVLLSVLFLMISSASPISADHQGAACHGYTGCVSVFCGKLDGHEVYIFPSDRNGYGNSVEIGPYRHPLLSIQRLDWGKEFIWPKNAKIDGLRCGDDVSVSENFVSIRHGNNLDLLILIGAVNGNFVRHDAQLQDGRHLGVDHTAQGPIITLGKNKDIRIKYCFDGTRWTSSHLSRAQLTFIAINQSEISWEPNYEQCGNPAITYFNGSVLRTTAGPVGGQVSGPRNCPDCYDDNGKVISKAR